jgi:hypothetical protein
MRPGTVHSDDQAFKQVLARLEGDVGTIITAVLREKTNGRWPDTAPLWALVRMMFPIAESLADLVYRTEKTADNLRRLFEREFEGVRRGYAGKAAILTLLFRHSLTHTDELRSLRSAGVEVGWKLSFAMPGGHLQVGRSGAGEYGIWFDTTAFYDDLAAVCRNQISSAWGGAVMARYNGWLLLDLDAKPKLSSTETAATQEIARLSTL